MRPGSEPRVIASDLDGTLLGNDGTVSTRTREALAAAREAGFEVVLASGRPIRFVRPLALELGLDEPVVCANGAVLYDPRRDEVLDCRVIPRRVLTELAGVLRERIPGVVLALEGARDFACEEGFARLARWPLPDDGIRIGDTWLDAEEPAKLLLRHPERSADDILCDVQAVVDGAVTVTRSSSHLIEFASAGVDKAAGVGTIVAERGRSAQDVVAFGDMPNDVALLSWAGWGVAVANAHPEVLEIADHVAPANHEDGVAQVVEGLVAGRTSVPRVAR